MDDRITTGKATHFSIYRTTDGHTIYINIQDHLAGIFPIKLFNKFCNKYFLLKEYGSGEYVFSFYYWVSGPFQKLNHTHTLNVNKENNVYSIN